MPLNFSSYLDVVRFLAAMVVFLGHASGIHWTAGLLWQLGDYGDTCVVIFFVLSGFVIAYVTDVKERTWETYLNSRAARLWSVVLPALALTFVIDWFGVRAAPALYLGQPWFAGDHLLLRYIASLLMLQEVWHLKLVPGINAPFWSLSYEAIYYLLFGVLFFSKRPVRWLWVALLLALSGPVIAALFPIWGLGFVAYRFCRKRVLSRTWCWLLAIAGLALLVASPHVRYLAPAQLRIMDEEIVGRYIDALAFLMHLTGMYGLANAFPPLPGRLRSMITTVAATTFPLYLLHRPLIQFFSYAGPEDPSGWQRRTLVIAGTLLLVFIATPPIERFRLFLKAGLDSLLQRARIRRQHAAMSARSGN
ncbi:MAG TPA: acyltransferase [Noviherbaspirillum sp.]